MAYSILFLIQSIILIGLAPLFSGIIKKFKAIFRGYKGPSIFQVYYDVKKTFNKGMVLSSSSSFITSFGPAITLATAIITALFIPVFYTEQNSYFGNLLFIVLLLGIIKFMNSLMGLDVASTFGGMGSARELFFSVFCEPILFLIGALMFVQYGSFNVFEIAFLNSSIETFSISTLIASVAFWAVLLAENARMPIDNPETHLELTMVHEAMILDISGRNFAYVELGSSIKLMAFFTLFINLFFPFGIATTVDFVGIIIGIVLFLLKILCCILILTIIEVSIAKFRVFRVPDLLFFAFALATIALIGVLII